MRDTDAVPLNLLRRKDHSNILFLWLTTVALLLSMLMLHSKKAQNIVKNPRVLMVVTSAAKMPNGEPTGLWLEEFAVPYEVFKAAGAAITVASLLAAGPLQSIHGPNPKATKQLAGEKRQ